MLLPLLTVCSIYIGTALSVPVTERDYASAPVVAVKNGTYSGIHSDGYDQDFFLGMPYAQVCTQLLLSSFPITVLISDLPLRKPSASLWQNH